ncbi:MAG: Cytochrome bo(3) ubiquinol oxidase subunit 3 [Chlamydiae bacterium]|nr:Cytochrome bo(3) ubiquinol oxidase subunit 3 [Chlamydiota bacterium]
MTEVHESYPDTHHDPYSKTVFGFWVYLLTDLILFGALFATYAVLGRNFFGGPSGKELFHLPFTLTETIILLTCSFTSGMGGALAHRKNKKGTIFYFLITVLLGIVFLGMEYTEFSRFIEGGNKWDKSAFLSTFFTLVGTHGLHVAIAVLWTLVLLPLVYMHGITSVVLRRMTCLKMFWQFINIVWVFIFTLVYLLGGELG